MENVWRQALQIFRKDPSRIWVSSGIGEFNKAEFGYGKFPTVGGLFDRFTKFKYITIKSSTRTVVIEPRVAEQQPLL